MKQIHLYIVSVVLLLFSACSSDNDELPGGDNTPSAALRIEVSASDFTHAGDANTRATDSGNTTTFEPGDRIGITVLDDGNNVLYDNIPYKYNGSTWSFDSGNSEGKTIIYYDNKAAACLAYFPYSKDADNITSKDALKEKFKPQPDQRSKNAYRASDLLVWSETYNATAAPSKKLKIAFSHAYSSISFSPLIKYNIDESTKITYTPSSDKDVSFTIGIEPLFPYPAADGSYRMIVAPQTTNARWFYGYGGKTYGGTMPSTTLSANIRYTLAPVLDIGEYGLDDAKMGDFYCSAKNDDSTITGYLIPCDAATLPEGTVCLGIVLKAGKDSDADWKDDCTYRMKDGITEMGPVNGYVLALYDANNGEKCTWGSLDTKVEYMDMMNRDKETGFYGYKNTQAVILFAKDQNKTLKTDFPAIYWVTDNTEGYEYSCPAPTNSSGWFLPSAGQCKYWLNNKDVLLSSVRKATGKSGYEWKYYWSSSERSNVPSNNAWYADFDRGIVDGTGKNYTPYVRACLAF